MPRRELLTPAQREQLLAFPTDEAELIRLYSLGEADHTILKAHRGAHNRLGVAVQIAYLRFPGRPIARGESPHAPLLAMVAAQLKAPATAWDLYAARDETRREHAVIVTRWLGLHPLDLHAHRSLSQWLLAAQQPVPLGETAMRSRSMIGPACPQSAFFLMIWELESGPASTTAPRVADRGWRIHTSQARWPPPYQAWRRPTRTRSPQIRSASGVV